MEMAQAQNKKPAFRRTSDKENHRARAYEYDIPDYSYVNGLIRTDVANKRTYRHFMDTAGRIYFAARPEDFPLLHELNEGSATIPWIVLLPLYISRQQPEFDFPYPDAPDAPWVQVRQNMTQKTFVMYASETDFRPGRAVGVAFVSRIRQLLTE